MSTIILAVVVAAYGATAVLVAVDTWRTTPQSEVDDAVAWAQLHVSPLHRLFTPIVERTARPVWAMAHGLIWPLVVLSVYRHRHH